jgi:vancomycin resistance protein VanJ
MTNQLDGGSRLPEMHDQAVLNPTISRTYLRTLFRSRLDVLAIIPAAVVAFALLAALVPLRSGPAALALVLEQQLFIAALVVLAPLALLARARLLALSLAVTLVAGGLLFGSEWISLPGSAAGRTDITVLTWNVQYGMRTPEEQAGQLHGVSADIVALLEVEPDAAAAIEADASVAAAYPYRAMAPRPGPWGLAVLSHYPISKVFSAQDPACLEMDIETPRGPVHVIVAHPIHAMIQTRTPIRVPVTYDPTERDAGIAAIRAEVESTLAAGERLLLLGDFNTAPSEAEYAVLAAGLRDTHAVVGQGPGWTWRPSRFTFLPVGLLRIDLQLTGGAIYPASTSIDCSLPGDHCRLFAGYEVD